MHCQKPLYSALRGSPEVLCTPYVVFLLYSYSRSLSFLSSYTYIHLLLWLYFVNSPMVHSWPGKISKKSSLGSSFKYKYISRGGGIHNDEGTGRLELAATHSVSEKAHQIVSQFFLEKRSPCNMKCFNRHCRARPCKWPQPYDPDFDLSMSDLFDICHEAVWVPR